MEGRTITCHFKTFILVACYVPNSGVQGLGRLRYRIDSWDKDFHHFLKEELEVEHVPDPGPVEDEDTLDDDDLVPARADHHVLPRHPAVSPEVVDGQANLLPVNEVLSMVSYDF